MTVSFRDAATAGAFDGRESRRGRRVCPSRLWSVARRKLDQLDSAVRLEDLALPPGNRLEPLSGDRVGQHSIRINRRYRICFAWTARGPEAVQIVDYH